MKPFIEFLFLIIIITCSINIKAEITDMDKTDSCFSKANFSAVYSFIKNQNKKENRQFFEYDGYELFPEESMEISLKKNGYTLARISKESGIFSLAKMKSDNDRIVEKTGRIFCSILSIANDKN